MSVNCFVYKFGLQLIPQDTMPGNVVPKRAIMVKPQIAVQADVKKSGITFAFYIKNSVIAETKKCNYFAEFGHTFKPQVSYFSQNFKTNKIPIDMLRVVSPK